MQSEFYKKKHCSKAMLLIIFSCNNWSKVLHNGTKLFYFLRESAGLRCVCKHFMTGSAAFLHFRIFRNYINCVNGWRPTPEERMQTQLLKLVFFWLTDVSAKSNKTAEFPQ